MSVSAISPGSLPNIQSAPIKPSKFPVDRGKPVLPDPVYPVGPAKPVTAPLTSTKISVTA